MQYTVNTKESYPAPHTFYFKIRHHPPLIWTCTITIEPCAGYKPAPLQLPTLPPWGTLKYNKMTPCAQLQFLFIWLKTPAQCVSRSRREEPQHGVLLSGVCSTLFYSICKTHWTNVRFQSTLTLLNWLLTQFVFGFVMPLNLSTFSGQKIKWWLIRLFNYTASN